MLDIFTISSIAIIFPVWLSLMLMMNLYLNFGTTELLFMTFGFFFMLVSILPFPIFLFFQGSNYNTARIIASIISSLAVIIAHLFILYSIVKMGGGELNILDYFMSFASLFATGLYISTIKLVWNGETFISTEINFMTLIPYSICLLYLIARITYGLLKTYPISNDKISHQLILFGWILNLSAGILSPLEKAFIHHSIIYSLTIGSFGFLIMSVGIFKSPRSIIPQTIGLKYVIIINRKSGEPVFSFRNTDTNEIMNESLLSGALKGILLILEELIGYEHPDVVSFYEYHITIKSRSNFILFAFSRKQSNLLLNLCNKALHIIDTIYPNEDQYHKFDRVKLRDIMEDIFEPLLSENEYD